MGQQTPVIITSQHYVCTVYCVLWTVHTLHARRRHQSSPPQHSEQSICKYAVKQLSAEWDTDSETRDWAWHQTSRGCQASDDRHLTSAQGWHTGHLLRHHDVQRRGGHHRLRDGLHIVQPRHNVSDTSQHQLRRTDGACFDFCQLEYLLITFRIFI